MWPYPRLHIRMIGLDEELSEVRRGLPAYVANEVAIVWFDWFG